MREARGRPLPHAILELVWHGDGVTRAGIARSTGLARSTVSEIVGELLETGLIVEAGDAPSGGGRRAVMLAFATDAHTVLGVDVGASHVGVVLTDLRGRVLDWRVEPCSVRDDPDATVETVRRLAEATRASGDRAPLLGVGVGMPAPIDTSSAIPAPAPAVLPAWEGHTGLADLVETLAVPMEMENDANLGALAELWWGNAESAADFTFVKVATGVGAGHIVRGEILRGTAGVAGEIGHVTIDPAGEPCVCGNRGCLTTFVGTQALLRRVRELRSSHPNSSLSEGEPTLDRLVAATLDDDPLALEVMEEAGHHLGDAIAGLVNLMNPEEVVLGGGLTRVGERLLEPLRREVARRTLVHSLQATRIRASTLGEQDVALGAATLVIASALQRPDRYFPAMAAT